MNKGQSNPRVVWKGIRGSTGATRWAWPETTTFSYERLTHSYQENNSNGTKTESTAAFNDTTTNTTYDNVKNEQLLSNNLQALSFVLGAFLVVFLALNIVIFIKTKGIIEKNICASSWVVISGIMTILIPGSLGNSYPLFACPFWSTLMVLCTLVCMPSSVLILIDQLEITTISSTTKKKILLICWIAFAVNASMLLFFDHYGTDNRFRCCSDAYFAIIVSRFSYFILSVSKPENSSWKSPLKFHNLVNNLKVGISGYC